MSDPVAGSEFSSQGTSVSFNGVNLGRLVGFDSTADAGQLADVTSAASTTYGSGAGRRVVTSYDCTTIDPPTLTLSIFGPPHYSAADVGLKATLAFSAPGNSRSGTAILVGISHRGRRGEYAESTATFQWVG